MNNQSWEVPYPKQPPTSTVMKQPSTAIVKPAVTADEVREAIKAYIEIRNACLFERDLLYIGADGKPRKYAKDAVATHVKKSGWRTVGVAYNLSWTVDDPVLESSEDRFGKFFVYKSRATVIAPNGRYVSALGACSSRNPFFSKAHGIDIQPNPEDIAMMSQTVAINRAISDMVGGGEVSAEEIMDKKYQAQPPTSQETSPSQKPKRTQPQPKPEPDATGHKLQPLTGTASDSAVLALKEWFERARIAGMTTEAYDNMKEHFKVGCTYEELATIEEWLMKHYLNQKPG